MKPVYEINTAIIRAAITVHDSVRPFWKRPLRNEAVSDEQPAIGTAVLYQSVYLFRALTMQMAGLCLIKSQLDRFNSLLDPLLASAAISSYFPHACSEGFPQDIKNRFIRDYYQGGSEAESRFSQCTSGSTKHGQERWMEILRGLSEQVVENISSFLPKSGERRAAVQAAVSRGMNEFFAYNMVGALREVAKLDIPRIDAQDFLRHLMSTQTLTANGEDPIKKKRQRRCVPVSRSPSPNAYILSEKDRSIVAATKLLLKKMVRHPSIKPVEMEVVTKVLMVFERLPGVSDELHTMVDLTGPNHQYGDHRISHWWRIAVDGTKIHVSSNGYFHRPSSGGDSFTCMQWQAQPGRETSYGDYLDTLQIVDDAQPYETEVAHLPISEPGYYVSVEVDGEKLAKPSDDEDWELDSSADNDEDWEEDSPTDDAEIQPCDESERMLTTEADEVKGLREGTFSGSSPQACDLCGRDLTVRKYYLDARH